METARHKHETEYTQQIPLELLSKQLPKSWSSIKHSQETPALQKKIAASSHMNPEISRMPFWNRQIVHKSSWCKVASAINV